jgi:hypothetical protein
VKRELQNAGGRLFVTIFYDAENHWVYNNWFGSQTLESVRQGADACLEVLREHNCSFLLNDNRLVAGPWSQATEWIITSWVPRAVTAGLTHFAHVTSPEGLARLSGDNLQHRVNKAFQMQIFEKVTSAQEWLKLIQLKISSTKI